MRRILIFLYGILVFPLVMHAGNIPPADTSLTDDEKIERWLFEHKVPALGIGVIRNGTLRQVSVYGELKSGSPAPFNTIFNVASLTKTVVCQLVLELVSTGQWDLDEPLYKYWTDPDVISDPRHEKLTARHVLTHSTGFVNWRWLHKTGKLTFDFEPGTRFQYSGEGYEYLKKALENKFNMPLTQLADSLLFKPLKMNDTHFSWAGEVDETRFAVGHNEKGEPYPVEKYTRVSAADDLLTTIADYGKLSLAAMQGTGLSRKVYREMLEHQLKIKTDKYVGLGWMLYDNLGNGEYALSHGGSDNGCRTMVFLLPKSGRGLIIMTNSDNGMKIIPELLKYYLGEAGEKLYEIEMSKE